MGSAIVPLIVLVHGLGFWGKPYEAMQNVQCYLNSNGYEARVVRLPGFNSSQYRAPVLLDELNEIIRHDSADETRLHLIGHSQGGLTTMDLFLNATTDTQKSEPYRNIVKRHIVGADAIATPWHGADFPDGYSPLFHKYIRGENEVTVRRRPWAERYQRMVDWYGHHVLRLDQYPLDSVALVEDLSGEYRAAAGLRAPWEEYNQMQYEMADCVHASGDLAKESKRLQLPPIYTHSAIAGEGTDHPITTQLLKGLNWFGQRHRDRSGKGRVPGDGLFTEASAHGPGEHLGIIYGDHFLTGGYLGPNKTWPTTHLRVYRDIANRIHARPLAQ